MRKSREFLGHFQCLRWVNLAPPPSKVPLRLMRKLWEKEQENLFIFSLILFLRINSCNHFFLCICYSVSSIWLMCVLSEKKSVMLFTQMIPNLPTGVNIQKGFPTGRFILLSVLHSFCLYKDYYVIFFMYYSSLF